MTFSTNRRNLLRGLSLVGGTAALSAALPGWARSGTGGLASGGDVLSGEDIRLSVGHAMHRVGGRSGHAIAINGTVPGPLIRLKEGQNVRLSVTTPSPRTRRSTGMACCCRFNMMACRA